MNTLKSTALIVVLLGVLYGVYVALSKPELPAVSGGREAQDVGPPLVEFAPTHSGAAHTVQPSPAPPLVRGHDEENPASASNPRAVRGGSFQPKLDRSSLPPPTSVPSSDAPADPASSRSVGALRRSTYEAPATAERTADLATSATSSSSPAPALESPSPAATPSASSGSGGSPALAAWSLRRDWQEAEQLVASGKFKAALAKLSPQYGNTDLPSDQRAQLVQWLDALAAKVIYSRDHLLAMPYQVRKGETLFDIAEQHRVPWLLLQNINSQQRSDPTVLVPGTELKVVPGPFRADVNLVTSELTLFLGELYAGRFPFTVGDQPPSPGQYKVLDKLRQQKSYYGLDGRVIPANDPQNPYGGWWLSLGGEICIHGSPAAPARQTLGCISLSPQDAKDVYGILSMGSEVMVRR